MTRLLFIFLLSFAAEAKELINVRFGVLEGLSPTDSSSSDRYRRAFEAAIHYAVGENEKQINKCGYKFEIYPAYYDSGDRTAPKKNGKILSDKESWIIFGPRRSDDFMASLPGLDGVPMVSPMANGFDIYKLSPPLFTMYPDTDAFADAAIKVLKKENYGKKYASVVDITCPAAVDFETSFQKKGKPLGFERVLKVELAGDEPNVADLLEKLKTTPIDFMSLPSNSKFAGFVMSKVQKEFPKIKFLGTHGWGDNNYGFIGKYGLDEKTVGMCVRQGRKFSDLDNIYKVHSLDYEWKEKMVEPNFTAISAIHMIRLVSKDLCRWKPKTRADFASRLKKLPHDYFQTNEPMSVYKLEGGKLAFGYEIKP